MISKKFIEKFQKEILQWYRKNKRDLPWRHDREPYHILVSEVMLQQTQVGRVTPKYIAWMKRFPDIESLAKASTRNVLLYWSGLGYNRRALYLRDCAKLLVHGKQTSPQPSPKRRGRSRLSNIYWPENEQELRKLPGIGEYTARALLCFAFNKQVAVVDTNVRKVIITNIQISNNQYPISNKEIQDIATKLLPKNRAYEWNQALMDYSSAMLKKEKISIPRQSTFKDSDRYYRGQIVKYLLTYGKTSKEKLYIFFANTPTMTKQRFEKIVRDMSKDRLIVGSTNGRTLRLEE